MFEITERDGKKVLSAGYPAVEKLIESEDFSTINRVFEAAYDELEAISRKKRGLKKSRDAKKAMKAIERVMDLFRELLEIKYQIQAMLDRASSGKKRKQ